MEKNNLSNTSIEKQKCKELRIDIEERLKPAPDQCCIYRVPKNLRKIKAADYTPQFISIGPFHHGKKEFLEMEKQKVRYKREFGERNEITGAKLESLITFITDNERKIRDCYSETSKLQPHEFITMILYDAIFIIELLLKNYHNQKSEFLLNNSPLEYGIRHDLQLLENQLPHFVLEELYKSAFASHTGEVSPSFINLACRFLQCRMPDGVATGENLKHFVDLKRNNLLTRLPKSRSVGHIEDLPSAVKLHESGVKFQVNIESDSMLDIKFATRKLMIPRIIIEDGTECLIRNMMALEQCHYPYETHICNYIDLLDHLINTEKDVNLLVEKGIISNWIGDHAAIAKMFNKLCLRIIMSDSCYMDISNNLNAHHNKWWNRTMGALRSVYFSNLWRGTGTLAAAVLLLFTLLQTIYTMRT